MFPLMTPPLHLKRFYQICSRGVEFAHIFLILHNDSPSAVFSTLDIDQLGKIWWNHCEENLKITKIAKFESDTS